MNRPIHVTIIIMIDKEKVIDYWKKHAVYDMETAESLFASRRYPYCLFMCHLAVEKLLKSIIVETTSEHAPYTHNLVELATRSGASFDEEQKSLIAELNEFNIEARYPDWKRDFYARATEDFTARYLTKTKDLFLWLGR